MRIKISKKKFDNILEQVLIYDMHEGYLLKHIFEDTRELLVRRTHKIQVKFVYTLSKVEFFYHWHTFPMS